MDNNNRLTVYQKLSQSFSLKHTVANNINTVPSNTEILRTTNIEEFNTKKLELQQGNYLKRLWQKANSVIQTQVLQNEAKRIPSYIDYEKMDEYPLIGAALDHFMEETTTRNSEGNVLNITSNSVRVKEVLSHLFFDTVNINSMLPMLSRDMCKNGDTFVFYDVDPEKGIVDCRQLPVTEIDRDEGNLYNYIISNEKTDTVFRWRSTRSIEFKTWQIGHFRLLTSEKKLPYGVSILEKARRIWRNLLLVEDAMRTIRLIRASDRRVFYINTGNLDPNDTVSFINGVADRYKRKRIVDPLTGQEDLKANTLGIDQDYFIPIRGSDDGSKIDTLQGQTNLDIVDIEYDLKLLATALRVPKTYLNFDEAVGDGKSLSMLDIRFARTVNRIQMSLLQELNKMASVHLIALGLEDELHNFSLSLNNPSIQTEMLQTELLQNKISLFKDAVEALSNGIAPMSHTKAKKEILGFSDKEIMDDLIQQRIEKAIGAELNKTEQIIQRTGIFDDVDKKYGIFNAQYTTNSEGEQLDTNFSGGGGGFSDLSGSDDMSGLDDIAADDTTGLDDQIDAPVEDTGVEDTAAEEVPTT